MTTPGQPAIFVHKPLVVREERHFSPSHTEICRHFGLVHSDHIVADLQKAYDGQFGQFPS